MKRIDFIGPRTEEIKSFYKETEVSSAFHYSFTNTGTILATCEPCGRTYFDSTAGGFDEGELEKLQEQAQEFPDKYVDTDFSIAPVYLAGFGNAVMGCSCGITRFIEDFLWGHRQEIAQYLNERRQIEFDHAKNDFEKTEVKDLPE